MHVIGGFRISGRFGGLIRKAQQAIVSCKPQFQAPRNTLYASKGKVDLHIRPNAGPRSSGLYEMHGT